MHIQSFANRTSLFFSEYKEELLTGAVIMSIALAALGIGMAISGGLGLSSTLAQSNALGAYKDAIRNSDWIWHWNPDRTGGFLGPATCWNNALPSLSGQISQFQTVAITGAALTIVATFGIFAFFALQDVKKQRATEKRELANRLENLDTQKELNHEVQKEMTQKRRQFLMIALGTALVCLGVGLIIGGGMGCEALKKAPYTDLIKNAQLFDGNVLIKDSFYHMPSIKPLLDQMKTQSDALCVSGAFLIIGGLIVLHVMQLWIYGRSKITYNSLCEENQKNWIEMTERQLPSSQ